MSIENASINKALEAATRVQPLAYAPYSNFKMGAAVATEDGNVAIGALVENISFGLTMCAERAALFAAVAQGWGRAEVLALVAPETRGQLTWPCGACLQVAAELGGLDLVVAVSNGQGRSDTAALRDLAGRLPSKEQRAQTEGLTSPGH